MKKTVSFNEDLNEIKYFKKEIIDNKDDYLSTIFKYCCIKSDDNETNNNIDKDNNEDNKED